MPEREERIEEVLRAITREDHLHEVLVNLFDRMGLEPKLTHGTLENGSDIICLERNSFNIPEWIGIVAKVGAIKGSVNGSNSLQTILNQAHEALIHPYTNASLKSRNPLSKAVVIITGELAEHARGKLLDKVATFGEARGNIHFIQRVELARLLAEHWPEFLTDRPDIFQQSDRMPQEAGLILYLVARTQVISKGKTKRHLDPGLSHDDLIRQSMLPKESVRKATQYLLETQYLQLGEQDRFVLHRKLTSRRLLTDLSDIKLLKRIYRVHAKTGEVTAKKIYQIGKGNMLGFTHRFVKSAIEALVVGGYLGEDESRGNGHYIVNINMIEDEWEYLQCWVKFRSSLPRDNSKTIDSVLSRDSQ